MKSKIIKIESGTEFTDGVPRMTVKVEGAAFHSCTLVLPATLLPEGCRVLDAEMAMTFMAMGEVRMQQEEDARTGRSIPLSDFQAYVEKGVGDGK